LRKVFLIAFLFIINVGFGQSQKDSVKTYTSIKSYFQSGKFSGRSRLYFMATDNQKGLSDYQGLGYGAGLNYESPEIKGFSLKMGGYFILNLLGKDVTKIDSTTLSPSRYELGLFDIENPSNPNLVRLENLSIKYRYKNSSIELGQFTRNFAFLNGQDGRMTPTMVKGLSINTKPAKGLNLGLNMITKISPRSSLKWYSIGESMSLYPQGRNEEGTKSNYVASITSKNLLIVNADYSFRNKINISAENYYAKSLMNLAHLKAEYKDNSWFFGSMISFEKSLQPNVTGSYIRHNALAWSSQISRNFSKNNLSLSYTNIGKQGRFLFPREWGREPFYTFMPRERVEGNGDVKAIKIGLARSLNKYQNLDFSYGRFYLTSPSNPILNKYGMPSYDQLNISYKQKLHGVLDGFDYQILFVRKNNISGETLEARYIFNKVNLNLLNVIINFKF
jgi:hypothetical protein